MNTPDTPVSAPDTASEPAGGLTLHELCRACAVQSEFVLQLIDEGAVQPATGESPESWRFLAIQTQRISVAWRLQRDLRVNPAGAALALQLLDEIAALRAQRSGLTHPTNEQT